MIFPPKINDRIQSFHKERSNQTLETARLRSKSKTIVRRSMKRNSRLCISKINDQKQSCHKETCNWTLRSAYLQSRSETKLVQRSMKRNSMLYLSTIYDIKQTLNFSPFTSGSHSFQHSPLTRQPTDHDHDHAAVNNLFSLPV